MPTTPAAIAATTEVRLFSLLDADGNVRHQWRTTEARAVLYAMRFAVPSDRGLFGPTARLVASGADLFDLSKTRRATPADVYLDLLVEDALWMIHEDAKDGKVDLAAVRGFSDLHDFVDGNEYLIEAIQSARENDEDLDRLIAEDPADDDETVPESFFFGLCNRLADAIDARLRLRGMKRVAIVYTFLVPDDASDDDLAALSRDAFVQIAEPGDDVTVETSDVRSEVIVADDANSYLVATLRDAAGAGELAEAILPS